jgi:hypothetical protein
MKTTLEIEAGVMRRLKARAATQGITLSEVVESALRAYLKELERPKELPPLPTWNSGGFLVDIDDRNALYDAMEEDDDVRR